MRTCERSVRLSLAFGTQAGRSGDGLAGAISPTAVAHAPENPTLAPVCR